MLNLGIHGTDYKAFLDIFQGILESVVSILKPLRLLLNIELM